MTAAIASDHTGRERRWPQSVLPNTLRSTAVLLRVVPEEQLLEVRLLRDQALRREARGRLDQRVGRSAQPAAQHAALDLDVAHVRQAGERPSRDRRVEPDLDAPDRPPAQRVDL